MRPEKLKTRYWVIVASKDHVKSGVAEGIAQACHGKASPLRRMRKDDLIVYYSGKQTFNKPAKCQEFTAIGQVNDEEVFPFQMSADFCPFRRKVDFFPSNDVSILPLLEELEFIPNKKSWGYPFRFGLIEISQRDFELISSRMIPEGYVPNDRISFQ